jgi:polysaccharide biosynthesis/export protein
MAAAVRTAAGKAKENDLMRHFLCSMVLVLGLVLPPFAHAQGAIPANGIDAALEEYRIGAEDTLQISVWRNEAMSKTIPVRPDGMISLPLLNDVKAAGLTPAELRQVIATKLAEYMPTPEVSVILTDVKSFKVSVIGEVRRPARYELKSWTTILDVLALAGGFTEFAARGRIVVLRPNGKTIKSIQFNYNKVVTAGGEQENFYLRPGDIVLVP